MDGFDLLRLDGYFCMGWEDVDGAIVVEARLSDPEPPQCWCADPKIVKHGRRIVQFKDHPIQRQPTFIKISRQRWRCQNCKMLRLEKLPGIDADRLMTERFRDQLAKDGINRTFTDAAALNGLIDQINRSGRGYDLATLRAKALLRCGNVKPLIDIYDFDLMSVPEEEREWILGTNVGHGIDLSTFEGDMRRESFW